jgi:hypothetical protein
MKKGFCVGSVEGGSEGMNQNKQTSTSEKGTNEEAIKTEKAYITGSDLK